MDSSAASGSRHILSEDVLDRVRSRSPEALDVFFDYYYDRIYGYVCSLVGDPALGEDLTHEAFMRVHRAIHRLDPHRDPTPWIFKIVVNAVRDYWRSRPHRAMQREVSFDHGDTVELASAREGPLESIEREEVNNLVRRALASLSNHDREVILLKDYEMLKTSRTAEILGISIDAVRQRHARALSRLAKTFRKLTNEDSLAP